MEFFKPCWIALVFMFGPDPAPSKTYLHKVSRTIAERVFICNRIAIESRKKGVDPILALSVGMRESGFTYVTSKKGAQGPLGVLPRYHCKQGAHNCDLVKAGVSALSKLTVGLDHHNGVIVLDRNLEVVKVVFLKETGFPDGALHQSLRRGLAILL